MKRVVVDTSALASVIFNEEGGPEMARLLEGAAVYAPALRFAPAAAVLQCARTHAPRLRRASRPV